MKLRNTKHPSHHTVSQQPFWRDLDVILRQLKDAQLVCCPHSYQHEKESTLADDHLAIKKTYDDLSSGTSFKDPNEIRILQITEAVKAWVRGQSVHFDFHAADVVNGNPNAWKKRFYITFNPNPFLLRNELEQERMFLHRRMVEVFAERRTSEIRDFAHWFELEKRSFRDEIEKDWLAVHRDPFGPGAAFDALPRRIMATIAHVIEGVLYA